MKRGDTKIKMRYFLSRNHRKHWHVTKIQKLKKRKQYQPTPKKNKSLLFFEKIEKSTFIIFPGRQNIFEKKPANPKKKKYKKDHIKIIKTKIKPIANPQKIQKKLQKTKQQKISSPDS